MILAYEKLTGCLAAIREHTDFIPEIAIVLGSGLGGFADNIRAESVIPYSEIEGFPVSTVSGHTGQFVFGYLDEIPVAVMQGRVHYYEGYSIQDVVLPVRLMGLMGAKVLILTNAAGGVNFDFSPGDFMLIEDQISNFVPSPLNGPNMDALGPRFPDMSALYNPELREAIKHAAKKASISLKEGVYIQLPGPHYETPADVRMCRALGADTVGMSTACEAIAAGHMGLKICGISCISNLGSGMSGKPLSHEEVKEAADKAAPLFQKLLIESVREIHALV